MSPTSPQQQSHLLQVPTQPQGSHSAETPFPPSTQLTNGTPVPQSSSSPMSIPSGSPPQPSGEQAPESSSAPSDLCGHIHRWAKHASNNQGNSPAALHQLPQASPSCHFEQGSASNEGHHAARRSALHGSRSGRGKVDSGSGHGHGIRWNGSRDSLLSSHEDLAQLVPDRASKGGVEQAPEVASFTGQHLDTHLTRTDLPSTDLLIVCWQKILDQNFNVAWCTCRHAINAPVALCLNTKIAL